MEEQQQRRLIHRDVLDGIARLDNPHHREKSHKLIVNGGLGIGPTPPVDLHSLQHMVNFLADRDSHQVTELLLERINLVSDPSPDGGLEVLRSFFSNGDTMLTKVTLRDCEFGSEEDSSRLLAAFQTNGIITDFTIQRTHNLEDAALGACLSNLLQNMPQLQRLDCSQYRLRLEGARAFQPGLLSNRTLREFNLSFCDLRDDGIRLIADSLVGNTTIDILDIHWNYISSTNGLDDITRILESTRLHTIILGGINSIFDNAASTQRFTRVLSRHEFLKELRLNCCKLGDKDIRILADALVGNAIMEFLDIGFNVITSVGLAHITRLLVSTRLKSIVIGYLDQERVFNDVSATQHFVTTLQHKKSNVQKLSRIRQSFFSGDEVSKTATFVGINNSLTRNRQLNHVSLLLAPPPPQQQQQRQHNHHVSATMMLKTWHKAITKFAKVPNDAGASAIFKLFTTRPQLLEKRLKRPSSTAALLLLLFRRNKSVSAYKI